MNFNSLFLNQKKKIMKKVWSELPWYVKIIIIVLICIALFILIRNAVTYFKKMEAERLLNSAVASGTVGGVAYSTNYGSAAQRIYSAFYDNDWLGLTENEEAAIIAINDVPKAFVPQLKNTYFNMYSKNLEADCIKYLGDEYSRVQNQFN